MEGSSTNPTLGNKRRKSGAKKKDSDSIGMATGVGGLVSKVKSERSSDAAPVTNVGKGMDKDDEESQDVEKESEDNFDESLGPRDEDNKNTPTRSSRRIQQRHQRQRGAGDAKKAMSNSKKKKIKVKSERGRKISSTKKSGMGQFPCKEPLCSSRLSHWHSLIKHLQGKHDYNEEEAVSTVSGWYKKPVGKKRGRKMNINLNPFVCMAGCRDVGFQSRALLHSHLCTRHEFSKDQSDIEVAKEYGVTNSTRLPDSAFYSIEIKIECTKTGMADDGGDLGHMEEKGKPTCPKCATEFEQLSEARAHFEKECTSNPLQCKLCGTYLATVGGFKMHMETHSNQQHGLTYKCESCEKVFFHKYLLTQHEATHKKSFICDYCGKSFPFKAFYEQHKNSKHTKEKKFTCSECPKFYYTKRALNVHISSIHGDLETIPCHICGKLLKPSSMSVHISQVHTEEGTVQCPICKKEFKRQSYLDDHTKEVHENGAGTQYRCTWPNCDKVFVRKRSLKCHLDVHNDVRRFECSLCSKKFRSKAHLINHENWHKGIKPFSCTECPKSFLTSGNLKKHLVTHSRKKTSAPVEGGKPKEILVVVSSVQATPGESDQHQMSSVEIVRSPSELHVPIGDLPMETVELHSVVSEAYNLAMNT